MGADPVCVYVRVCAGHSVCAFVHGFESYFYVEQPCAVFGADDCAALTSYLNVSAWGSSRVSVGFL